MHSVILLAAGASTRMGQWKGDVLLPDGRTLLQYQLDQLKGFDVTLVTSTPKRIPNVRVVVNPAPERGPFSSLQCGLRGETYVLPIDVPCADVFDLIRQGRAGIPTYEGRGGHPVWLSAELVETLKTMPADSRLDHILRDQGATRIAVSDERVVMNLNSPSDVAAAFGATPQAPKSRTRSGA